VCQDRHVLALDHVILRSGDLEATLSALRDVIGLPVLAEPADLGGGLRSAILRAGPVDIEVLAFGDGATEVEGYGLGFVADDPDLFAVARGLRAGGLSTSPPVRGRADGRTWEALHVAGLLPDPFPVMFSPRVPGPADRVAGALLGLLARVPGAARMATSRPSRSMVVVTRYGFDADAWRAGVAEGPRAVAVEVGAGERAEAWSRLGETGGPRLVIRPGDPVGVRRVVLTGRGWPPEREPEQLGSVVFSAATRREDLEAE
jgi:hypothetical protein